MHAQPHLAPEQMHTQPHSAHTSNHQRCIGVAVKAHHTLLKVAHSPCSLSSTHLAVKHTHTHTYSM